MRLPLVLAFLLASASASAQVRCRKDSDCALMRMICQSPPCQGGWRAVGTPELRRMEQRQAAEGRCQMLPSPCQGRWVGSAAICRARRCVPEHAPGGGDPKHTTCRTDSDCVPRPRSGCGCAPCGMALETAVNRKHAEWLQKEYARESCPKVSCESCSAPAIHFKTKPICHARRCTMVPH